MMMTMNSQPSSPALARRARSVVSRGKSPRSIFAVFPVGHFGEFQTFSEHERPVRYFVTILP